MNIYESAEDNMERILIRQQKNGTVRSIDIVRDPDSFKASVSIAMRRPWESASLNVPVSLKVWIKSEHFEERIAAPVCDTSRNDRFSTGSDRCHNRHRSFFARTPDGTVRLREIRYCNGTENVIKYTKL